MRLARGVYTAPGRPQLQVIEVGQVLVRYRIGGLGQERVTVRSAMVALLEKQGYEKTTARRSASKERTSK
ncbi:MAG TPA: hypothetical protein VLV83_24110 [Acidobacteriota bacterium]|nr:hypothetical protein [Acidobacteriota bacterium]